MVKRLPKDVKACQLSSLAVLKVDSWRNVDSARIAASLARGLCQVAPVPIDPFRLTW